MGELFNQKKYFLPQLIGSANTMKLAIEPVSYTHLAREYLIVGKGVGFGKKITQSVEPTEEDSLYELTQTRDRGPAKDMSVSYTHLDVYKRQGVSRLFRW